MARWARWTSGRELRARAQAAHPLDKRFGEEGERRSVLSTVLSALQQNWAQSHKAHDETECVWECGRLRAREKEREREHALDTDIVKRENEKEREQTQETLGSVSCYRGATDSGGKTYVLRVVSYWASSWNEAPSPGAVLLLIRPHVTPWGYPCGTVWNRRKDRKQVDLN